MTTRGDVVLETERLVVREARHDDAADLCAYYARNAARLDPWEPPRSRDPAVHAHSIVQSRTAAARGEGVRLFLSFERDRPSELVGTVTLDGFGAVPPSAMIAYTIDAACEGRGLASESVAGVCRYSFAELALVELSAYYDPSNVRSEALLVRVGFTLVARAPAVPGLEHLMRSRAVATLHRPSDA